MDTSKPKFNHDCNTCEFIQTIEMETNLTPDGMNTFDLYVHDSKIWNHVTYLARYADCEKDSELSGAYLSGSIYGGKTHESDPVSEAYKIHNSTQECICSVCNDAYQVSPDEPTEHHHNRGYCSLQCQARDSQPHQIW